MQSRSGWLSLTECSELQQWLLCCKLDEDWMGVFKENGLSLTELKNIAQWNAEHLREALRDTGMNGLQQCRLLYKLSNPSQIAGGEIKDFGDVISKRLSSSLEISREEILSDVNDMTNAPMKRESKHVPVVPYSHLQRKPAVAGNHATDQKSSQLLLSSFVPPSLPTQTEPLSLTVDDECDLLAENDAIDAAIRSGNSSLLKRSLNESRSSDKRDEDSDATELDETVLVAALQSTVESDESSLLKMKASLRCTAKRTVPKSAAPRTRAKAKARTTHVKKPQLLKPKLVRPKLKLPRKKLLRILADDRKEQSPDQWHRSVLRPRVSKPIVHFSAESIEEVSDIGASQLPAHTPLEGEGFAFAPIPVKQFSPIRKRGVLTCLSQGAADDSLLQHATAQMPTTKRKRKLARRRRPQQMQDLSTEASDSSVILVSRIG